MIDFSFAGRVSGENFKQAATFFSNIFLFSSVKLAATGFLLPVDTVKPIPGKYA